PKKAGGRPGRTFMTLWIEEGHAVLMLDVEAQTGLVARYPKAFRPHPSKWGQQGATIAELVLMGEQTFRDALALAHAHAAR
ncbi:MAG: hypothetical protein KDB84_00365, partial [Flavobacteriales bacterium]|nr:hypothetical protein [Flavobacteriales bacterium]